jgi:autotransporter-associated beta strand protein
MNDAMNRVSIDAVFLLRSSFFTLRAPWFVALCTLLYVTVTHQNADAITINMEYTHDGSSPPHPESPTWDPAGVILKSHFQAAKSIWEALLPGGGAYTFNFHWDDDISDLGLYNPGIDEYIGINPNVNWFADPTPSANEEFSTTVTRTQYSQLSAADQATYFPGAAPPSALETRYNLSGIGGLPGVGGFHSQNGIDLLTVVMHEIGHALGISGIEPGEYNISPQHVGGLENVLVLEGGGGHLAGNGNVPGFLMCDVVETMGVRRLPSATDVLVIAEDQGITDVRLARVGRISSGLWSDSNAWIGGDVPDLGQDVYISHGGVVRLGSVTLINNLIVTPGNNLTIEGFLAAISSLTFDAATVSVEAGGMISAYGGSAEGDRAVVSFINGAHAGNATIYLESGYGGGEGALLTFDNAAKGGTAELIADAGATVDFLDQNLYGGTSVGSIEGAGTFVLRGSELTVGTRNTSTTVTGPIVDDPLGIAAGGRLTKVGTGTFTLAGENTYSGLTTVNVGTVSITGSIAGGVVVNNGGTLNGTGTIVGGVTINAGGILAPGASPGTISVDGLTMSPGSALNFELGSPTRDHIILTNNGDVSLAGTLNISLLDGFTPTLGQSFPLVEGAVGSISGVFDSVIAPTFNGLTIDLLPNGGSWLLVVVLAGDFNHDSSVDAADYVVWRKGLGTTYTPADFNVWRAHFGQTAGSGLSTNATVPEPASALLWVIGPAVMCWRVCGFRAGFHKRIDA